MNFLVRTAFILVITFASVTDAATPNVSGLLERPSFNTSRLVGSPDAPLAYRAKKAFAGLQFKHPLYISHLPESDQMLVVEQSQRILVFSNHPDATSSAEFCFIRDHEIYSVAFHPGYATNRFAFVFANGPQSSQHKTNKIFRYVVEHESIKCRETSKQLIIEWESNGHNGGDMAFGPDGMLYLSSGDGTSDSDRNLTGQDLTDLLSGILRLYVSPAVDFISAPGSGARRGNYSIPEDNPFLKTGEARGELWCYGMRNPWRIHFDSESNLWVGDIGQDTWEMIIIARRGANYGWSVTEGSHPFQLQRKRGPTPITPPTIEHPHSEARSITGGVVYRGHKLPGLRGAYIYGDYGTGRIWGARYRQGQVTWNELIADTPHQILGFGEDRAGELFYADYAGAIYELEASAPETNTNIFPLRLSDTGLFASVKNHRIAPGVIPYSVNAPYWADGAIQERFIALPSNAQIEFHERETWKLPEGSVLVQSLSLEMERGDPRSRKRLETRVLLLQQNEWAGYSYQWNEEQTEAFLITGGEEREFSIADSRTPGGQREQTWYYPTRTECLTCHSRQAGFVLGMNTWQMNRDHEHNGILTNQISTLAHLDLFKNGRRNALTNKINKLPRLVNPYDPTADVTNRVRAYLHANCSHCHTEAGGGNSAMELMAKTSIENMRIIDVRPQHDSFELPEPRIIAPGHPERSVMFRRISNRGFGQMPPFSVLTTDEAAVQLFKTWIRGLKAAD